VHSGATSECVGALLKTPNSSISNSFEFGFDSTDHWASFEIPSANFICIHHIHSLDSPRSSYFVHIVDLGADLKWTLKLDMKVAAIMC